MTDWNKSTSFLFSDMDGLGTPYEDDDTLIVSSGGDGVCDALWPGADGSRETANITINDGAKWQMENTVKLYCKANMIFRQWGGNVKLKGQPGGGTEFGEDNAAKQNYSVMCYENAIYSASYVNFGRVNEYILARQGGHVNLDHCNIKYHTNCYRGLLIYDGGAIECNDCTFTTPKVGTNYGCYMYDGGTVILRNCVFDNTWDYLAHCNLHACSVKMLGSISFAGATDPIAAWFSYTLSKKIYWQYYPKLTVNETNNVQDASLSIDHPSTNTEGFLRWEHNDFFQNLPPVYGENLQTDASGNSFVYALMKSGVTIHDGTMVIKYWSDSGEAETGDNQKYTVGLGKEGYHFATKTVWGDAGTVSFTLKTEMTESLAGTLVDKDTITGVIND